MNTEATNQLAARLICNTGDVYEFSLAEINLGRADDNQIVVNSRKASRYHAQIYYQDGKYYVRDLDSKNGTRLNGSRLLSDTLLNNGDHLRIGELEFTFDVPALADQTETVTATLTGIELSNVPLWIDFEAMQVKLNGQLLSPPLSPLEWKLLVTLYQQQGKVCTRDMLFATLYNISDLADIPLDTALETLVSRLRKRLEMTDPNRLPYIRAVRGAGYRFEL
ncbi:MAG TPA: FHA domain-containing protein [Chloroflexia bacterium]|nr:FHA domain-containing protein [Chloroflexia bacterium]